MSRDKFISDIEAKLDASKQRALHGEMRRTLDLALQDSMPLAETSAEQRAEWAERRRTFWRNRCLEHARTIDRQLARIHELIDKIKRLERTAGMDDDPEGA